MTFIMGSRSEGSSEMIVWMSRKKGLNSREVFVRFCSSERTFSQSTGSEMIVPSKSKTKYLIRGSLPTLKHLQLRPVVLPPEEGAHIDVPQEVVSIRQQVGLRGHLRHFLSHSEPDVEVC